MGAMLAAVTLGAAACGGPAQTPPSSPHVEQLEPVRIETREIPGLGTILVNGQGYTLYMFPPDQQRHVTCTGPCAGSWPPAAGPADQPPQAGPGVDPGLLSSVPNPNPQGGKVATYNGWPLYTYVGDLAPGNVTGQALDLNGGYWYVMNPSGEVITDPPPAGS